jgi:hypothetical protein
VSRRELLMATIHPRLQTANFRFVLLGSSGEELKKPFEKSWQETANYRHDDPKLSSHRGNHGICGGFGDLHVVDCDDLARWTDLEILSLIPATFTIESRPGHRQYYLLCKEHFKSGGLFDPEKTENNELGKPEYVHIGDLKAIGGQAVAPGCRHPSGTLYQVVVDAPIAEVSPDHLRSIINKFRQSKKVNGNYQKAEDQGKNDKKKEMRRKILSILCEWWTSCPLLERQVGTATNSEETTRYMVAQTAATTSSIPPKMFGTASDARAEAARRRQLLSSMALFRAPRRARVRFGAIFSGKC